jgi:hypothetical protein
MEIPQGWPHHEPVVQAPLSHVKLSLTGRHHPGEQVDKKCKAEGAIMIWTLSHAYDSTIKDKQNRSACGKN